MVSWGTGESSLGKWNLNRMWETFWYIGGWVGPDGENMTINSAVLGCEVDSLDTKKLCAFRNCILNPEVSCEHLPCPPVMSGNWGTSWRAPVDWSPWFSMHGCLYLHSLNSSIVLGTTHHCFQVQMGKLRQRETDLSRAHMSEMAWSSETHILRARVLLFLLS